MVRRRFHAPPLIAAPFVPLSQRPLIGYQEEKRGINMLGTIIGMAIGVWFLSVVRAVIWPVLRYEKLRRQLLLPDD